jgi:signal transduction histidine kinase/CheY-like chemotaxis protein
MIARSGLRLPTLRPGPQLLRRLHSIDWKFPLLLSGLVLATAVLFVGTAYLQFAGTLYDASGQRLRTSSLLVSGLIAQGAPRRQAQMSEISRDPAVIEFLRSGQFEPEAAAAIERSSTKPPEPGRLSVRLFDANGNERLAHVWNDSLSTPSWASREIKRGSLASKPLTVGPILNNRGVAEYQIVSLIADPHAGEKAHSTILGYVVDSRAVVGKGQKAIQDLIGGGATLLIGQPGGAWTDLEKIVPGAPMVSRTGVPFVFDKSPRGAGIGVAQAVPGTPWIVWLQQPRTTVLAPVRQFVWRIIPTAGGVALVGALLVLLFSRRITRRIVRLTEEVDRMEPGDRRDSSSGLQGADEIARLRASFERMSERIKSHRELEAQLRQSQKLEAVGRLAGGIAHDFNNILTVIRNYSELVREELSDRSDVKSDMDEVITATDRASGLTRQLLAFSRHQIVTPRVLDLNEVLKNSEKMLRRLVPTNIELVTDFDPTLGRITADNGQIEQVILNLTINAADALPSGGKITIHTQNAELDDTFAKGVGSFANVNGSYADGPHASLVVTDNGSGMDAATLARIFDPFFTTKEPGKGTGLGLSTVHGIVNQNGGRVWVYSEPGRGTTFKLYFPVVESEVAASNQVPDSTHIRAGGGDTILLVEDDPATREVTRRVLARGGYAVVEATNGVEGLEVLATDTTRVDLVLTDLMMPRMSGAELFERVGALYPGLPVLLMSGYAEVDVHGASALDRSQQFLEKPFTASALLTFVGNALAVARAA